ncbi:hypothetical protein CSPX01_17233 [Colletotrichum filicis]|nr:hypothetical protein CSPX01_17233 [Colletotrichum filicis]
MTILLLLLLFFMPPFHTGLPRQALSQLRRRWIRPANGDHHSISQRRRGTMPAAPGTKSTGKRRGSLVCMQSQKELARRREEGPTTMTISLWTP